MWERGTAALMAILVVGCSSPGQFQAPGQVQAPEQLSAPGQGQPPEQVQTPEQAQALERQKRELHQKRVAADKKRAAAEKERIADHLKRDLAPVCTSAGLVPGTEAHSHCVDSLYRKELERTSAPPK